MKCLRFFPSRLFFTGAISDQRQQKNCRAASHVASFAIIAFFGLTGCLTLSGCQPSRTTHTSAEPDSPPARARRTPKDTADLAALRADSTYKQAEARFGVGDREGAKTLLDRLLTRADLSATQMAFLTRQKALCDIAENSDHSRNSEDRAGNAGNTVSDSPVPPTSPDCGPRALLFACHALGVDASVERLAKAAKMDKDGTSLAGLADAARSVGLHAEGIQTNEAGLAQMPTPALAWMDGNHFVTVLKVGWGSATLHDPNHKDTQKMPLPELLRRSGGVMLLVSRPTKQDSR